MEATVYRHLPQPLLPVAARIAVAVATLAIVTAGVAFAGRASEAAVVTAQAAIAPASMHIALPGVQIVGRRGDAVAGDVACVPAPARM